MYEAKITHLRPGTLQIVKSRPWAALGLVANLSFLAIFDFTAFALASALWPERRDLGTGSGVALFFLVWVLGCLAMTFFSLPDIFYHIRVVVAGEILTFRRDTGTIEHNGKLLARFGDVACVEMRKHRPEEMTTELGEIWNSRRKRSVRIVLRNGQKLSIFHPSRIAVWPSRVQQVEMINLARALADILDVELVFAYGDLP